MSEIDPSYWDAPPEPYEGAFFDAFESAVAKASGKGFTCRSCGRRVLAPCTEPVDMGGGMVDTPCDLVPLARPSGPEGKK